VTPLDDDYTEFLTTPDFPAITRVLKYLVLPQNEEELRAVWEVYVESPIDELTADAKVLRSILLALSIHVNSEGLLEEIHQMRSVRYH
jgi:hypothetical protein